MNPKRTKGNPDFSARTGLDPAIDLLLSQGEKRQAAAHLPRRDQARQRKERARAEVRKPRRLNLDLPVELKDRLKQLAEREGVPVSQLVAFLLLEPVARLERDELSLRPYKLPSGSPKYLSVLDLHRRIQELTRKS